MGSRQPSRHWQIDRLLNEMVLSRTRQNATARAATPPAGPAPAEPLTKRPDAQPTARQHLAG